MKKKMLLNNRLGLDVDGPLYPVQDILCKMANKSSSMSQWEFWRDWDVSRQQFDDFYCDAILNKNLFNEVAVSYEVKSTIDLLKDMGYKIILCTVRGVGLSSDIQIAAQNQTLQWLEENNLYYDEIIFTNNKCDANSFCFFDDNIQNYEALEKSQGCTPWLYTLPYNESHRGRRVRSFRSIPGAVLWTRRNQDNNGSRSKRNKLLV